MCVGFLWTSLDRVLFDYGMIMVLRNGFDPSDHVSSTVNMMALYIVFMYC